MDTISVSTTLTIDDYRALQAQCPARMRSAETARGQWTRIFATTAVVAGVTLLATSSLASWALDAVSLLAGIAVIAVALFVNAWLVRRSAAPDPKGAFMGPCAYELDGAGLRCARGTRASSVVSWAAVLDVTFTATHVFVWVDRFSAYTIPGRDLPNGLTTEQLADWIAAARAHAGASGAAAEPPTTAPPPLESAGAARLPRRARAAWLLDLASLIALRGKDVLTEPTHAVPATLTTLLAVGTWLAFDRWENGPGAEFFVYGLADVSWFLLGGLVVASVLARASFPRIALPRAIVVCALGAWLAILYRYSSVFVEREWLAMALAGAAVLYVLAFFARAARALTGRSQPGATIAAFLVSLAFFWLTGAMWVYPMAWTPGESYVPEGVVVPENVEPLFFAQRDKVDIALAAVAPNDPASDEIFFVGFAGYGDEAVFAEEIKFAARTVAERYRDAAGSVLLLNDARDFHGAPLATASTLRYALNGVAAKMDLDDDILFLALSSHGSSEWTLSVSNGGLPLTDLAPEELAAALHYAGIKWRVIIISACYAGGFIDALQDPYTIVLAAAAPDRTSFGCSNDRELTYFGEAFYRDALPTALSLRDAFSAAERRVLERENAEGIEPSQPVAFFGEELERKLAALE